MTLIGHSYKNGEFDWPFLFRDCIMRVKVPNKNMFCDWLSEKIVVSV